MVCINAVFVGIQTDSARTNKVADRPDLFAIDVVFFVFFFSEMLIRMTQYYWNYFTDSWNLFDYFVISLTLFDITAAFLTGETGTFKMALAVRILRVARIIRYIRGMKLFLMLWMSIKGLTSSIKTLMWVSLMLIVIVYCTSIALNTILQDTQDEEWLERDIYFGSVPRCMWTVIQLITFDSWATEIMQPLMPISLVASVILFLIIIVGSFGVVNVIIAVMVDSARANSEENKQYTAKIVERNDEDIVKSLGESFDIADEDGSGELDQAEFGKFISRPDVAFRMKLLGIGAQEASELFDVIDVDGSGVITPDEYTRGLRKLRGKASGQDLVSLISFSQKQHAKAKIGYDRLKNLNLQADKMISRMRLAGKQMTEELRERRSIEQRTQKMWKTTRKRHEVLAHLDDEKEERYPAVNE
jgi:voltage-gated sodium channel